MPVPVTVPRLGWNMEEGVFAGWLKQDGDTVRPGDCVFSLGATRRPRTLSRSTAASCASPPDGPAGRDKLPVGKVIAYLAQPGEAVTFPSESRPLESAAKADGGHATEAIAAGPAARRLARELGVDIRRVSTAETSGRVTTEDVRRHQVPPAAESRPAISPRARRVAAELIVDWTGLRGSGKTGRIRECDVPVGRAPHRPQPDAPGHRGAACCKSVWSNAPVTLTTQADATNLVNLRGQFQAAGPAAGDPVPGYTDFFVKLAAVALGQHPDINTRWQDGRLVPEKQIHVGIAVDTEAGLLVPVDSRRARGSGLRQLRRPVRASSSSGRGRGNCRPARCRAGRSPSVAWGRTGSTPSRPSSSIEIAILGVGAIRRQPVAVGEQVVVRDVVSLSLTFDHCAVDGAPAARFLQSLCKIVEAPGPWLLA